MLVRMKAFAVTAVLAVSLTPGAALAWGNTGHRMVGQEATRALPADLPAFMRTAQAIADVGEYSREPDRSKGAGRIHDKDRDAAHFFDGDADGRALGGPSLDKLPPTRADYEAGLQKAGVDSWKAGYLPYALVDAYQQLAKDMAYWRVLKAAEANRKWRANRAFFAADRRRREALILANLGRLSHYVADGSQPLHMSQHYNGWGDYPNPQGFTRAPIHGPFEGELVAASVRPDALRAAMPAPGAPCDCPIEQEAADYLKGAWSLVVPLYEMEKAGGLGADNAAARAMAVKQLAIAAGKLRDLTVRAWADSATQQVGWKPVAVADVVAGKVDPYPALYGID